jgi:PadR family transcriptional regulator, regulatory protein PadR
MSLTRLDGIGSLHGFSLFANIDVMRRREYLGNFELMVLLAIMRVGEDAYGVPISQQIEEQSGHEVAVASVYAALQRLEEKNLVSSRLGEATPERGGKAKKYFRLTTKGLRQVRSTRRTLTQLWDGLPQFERGAV